jgi:hypothetical protein
VFTAGRKKQNFNQTLERTTNSPVSRSFLAITGSPNSPPNMSKMKGNQFEVLREEEDEEDV